MDVNFPETCFQASAILRACEAQDSNSLDNLCPRFTNTFEQERRELLEAIVRDMTRSDMTRGGTSDSRDVNRRLLEHLAQPPRIGVSKLIH